MQIRQYLYSEIYTGHTKLHDMHVMETYVITENSETSFSTKFHCHT